MNRNYYFRNLVTVLLFTSQLLTAQVDSIMFRSGDFIIGEIKSMDKGVLVVETKYSDSNFKIEWDKVTGIHSRSQFLIHLTDGRKFQGRLLSLSDSTGQIQTINVEPVVCNKMEIVYLNAYDDKFKDRFSASIDLGFDMAKARALRTLTTRVSLGYYVEKWTLDATFNTLISTQDSLDKIQRLEADLSYRYLLPRRWYAITTVSGLTNTEQKLDLRMNAQLGFGRFMVRTNTMYWGAKLGFNRNIERYSNETEDRESWEGHFGTEVSLFNTGDLDLLFGVIAYMGLTEKGRWRSDTKLDIKYDLPLNLYIKMGLSFNFDNQPAEGASKIDYVFQTGFGWEW